MEPTEIIRSYYDTNSDSYRILIAHSTAVANKAIEIARRLKHLKIDEDFIFEAAMLHDIGIFKTKAPMLGCHGDAPYIAHGYFGREILDKLGYQRHALVCERHVGVGLTTEDIKRLSLPLPLRDMVPTTMEEKLVCYADKFFTKKRDSLQKEVPLNEVRQTIASYGADKLQRFEEMRKLFEVS